MEYFSRWISKVFICFDGVWVFGGVESGDVGLGRFFGGGVRR